MLKPKELKSKLRGPIASVPTFFTKSGAQDLGSVRHTVELGIDNGIEILLLTQGDSNYALQSQTEICALAKAVIEQTAGKATVLVGTHSNWWRDQIIGFARYVEELGADGIMVNRPSVSYGDATEIEDVVFETYQTIAQSVNFGVALNGVFSMRLLKRLAEIPNVVALKEDAGDAWCRDALWAVGKKLTIFGGGQNWRFLYGMLWGMTGNLDLYSLYAPQVTHQFWDAVYRKDFFTAAQLVDKYETPFFNYAISHPKGYLPVQQAAFEVFGRGPRWMRPPQPSLDDKGLNELRTLFSQMGLI